MKQQNNFDKNLSKKLSQEELDFDPKAWEMMEGKLDEENRATPLFKSRSILGLFLVTFMITCSVGAQYLWNSEKVLTSHAEIHPRPKSNIELQKVAVQEEKLPMDSLNLNLESTTPTVEGGPETKNPKPSANNSSSSVKKRTTNRETRYVHTGHTTSAAIKIPTDKRNSNPTATNFNIATSKTSEAIMNTPIIQQTERLEENNRLALSELNSVGIRNQILSWNKTKLRAPQEIFIDSKIERPKHQINISMGAGMATLDVEEPFKGDLVPVATQMRDQFLAVSYLNRMIHPRIGLELGAQVWSQINRISSYVLSNDEFLTEPAYGSVSASTTADGVELDVFANVHYYLPINRRTELDLYVGYYAANPFQSSGGWGSGNGSYVNGARTRFLSSDMAGNSGSFEGGRIKLGMNYNLLTNKINTVSFGISYMHEVVKDINGTYEFFPTVDNVNTTGNLATNGSGFKVQLNYSFGVGRQIEELRSRKMLNQNKWYLDTRYCFKQYSLRNNRNSLTSGNPQFYFSFLIGHYINKRWALEMGLEHYQFLFSTPREIAETATKFGMNRQTLLTIPMAVRYDIVQNNFLNLYGKGIFSKDIRLLYSHNFQGSNELNRNNTGFQTDEDRLLLNAGVEVGVEVKLFQGLHLGLHAKYNHPFSRAAKFQYPKIDSQGEFYFQDINLYNQYLGAGFGLKYVLN